jgi:hypothetical protein
MNGAGDHGVSGVQINRVITVQGMQRLFNVYLSACMGADALETVSKSPRERCQNSFQRRKLSELPKYFSK